MCVSGKKIHQTGEIDRFGFFSVAGTFVLIIWNNIKH